MTIRRFFVGLFLIALGLVVGTMVLMYNDGEERKMAKNDELNLVRSTLSWAKQMRKERDDALLETQTLRVQIDELEKLIAKSKSQSPKVVQRIEKEAIEPITSAATTRKNSKSEAKAGTAATSPLDSVKEKNPRSKKDDTADDSSFDICYTIDDIYECVKPELEYHKKTKVHFIPADKPTAGWRFQHLIRQGFNKHPAIEAVSTMDEAEFILYLPVSTAIPPKQQNLTKKINCFDESDGSGANRNIAESTYLIYLKRSFVTKKDGLYTGQGRGYERNYFPMAYSVSDEYFDPQNFLSGSQRKLDIVCSNRPFDKQPTRSRIVYWVADFLDKYPQYHGIAGEVNAAGRREINQKYFDAMRSTKILVTANPSFWEGDFRFFEAVASGALVFVDEMYIPHPHPFIHGKHLIVYDNSDQQTFQNSLKYYLEHPQEARAIARAGLRHALRYHRALSRMDWILRSASDILQRSQLHHKHIVYTHTARQIAYDVNSTTQVDPILDIASPALKRVDAKRNLGRRFPITLHLEDADYKRLVKQNHERRKKLPPFRRRRRLLSLSSSYPTPSYQ